MKVRLSLLLILAVTITSAAIEAGTLIVANKSDDTVDLVDPATGESFATIPTGNAPHEVETSPDGKLGVVADYGDQTAGSSLTVIDLARGEVVTTIDLGEHTRPHGLAWLEGDRLAVTTEGSGDLIIVDIGTGKVLSAIPTDQAVSHMVAVTPDRKRAFVANIGSGTMTAIDLEKGKKLRDVETGGGAEGVAVRPDGSEVWVTNREAGTVSVIDTSSLEILETIEVPGFPIRIEFSPADDFALVSAARAGEVVRIDSDTREPVLRKKLDLSRVSDDTKRLFSEFDSPVPIGIQFSDDGDRAYIAATQSDAVVVVDPETLEVVGVIKAGREPDGMAWAE